MRKITDKGITYYVEDVPNGRKSDGKVNYKRIRAKTKKECQQKIDDFKKQGGIDYKKNTLESVILEWLEVVKKPTVKDSSYKGYVGLIKTHVSNSSIANLRLNELDNLKMQKFYNSFNSPYSAKKIKILLGVFLNMLSPQI